MTFEYITGQKALEEACKKLSKANYLYLDTETAGDRIRLIQVGDEENTFVIDLYEMEDLEPLRKLIS
ncbi:MAG TPA: bifunctional 3'-5' exonuclease/DNA polymerase, partial [Aquificaceae bacterium]|nr:bifunctional 3'-5' exonuclease/DNA polymerase [Aquificaceae bacterium]